MTMIVKHKEPVIKAWQWNQPEDPPFVLKSYTGWTIDPDDVVPLVEPYCARKSVVVTDGVCSCGRPMSDHGVIPHLSGAEKVCPGDYIVKENDHYNHMSEDEFNERYTVIESD